jgi:hypothetical protein
VLTEELVTAVAVISGLCTIIEFAHKVVTKIKANLYTPKHMSK